MRLRAPRIQPLQDDEFTPEQQTMLQPYRRDLGTLNIYRTLGRNPEAAQAFLGWGMYLLRSSKLDARLRELVILRIGWLCRSGYEWTQHARLGRLCGLTEAEIERIKTGPEDPAWTTEEMLFLKAADELHNSHFIADATWDALAGRLSEADLMDLVYVVGHYTQVSMILNTFGIQVEADQILDESLRWPAPRARRAKASSTGSVP